MSDDELHITIKDQVLLVLRSRQQVDEALTNYHNELNHLDINKCLRLLNERFAEEPTSSLSSDLILSGQEQQDY